MRILLAGGSGAIGLPLTRRLVAAGHSVDVIHRAPQGRVALQAEGATPVQADVLDRPRLLEAVAGREYDAVVSELTALKKVPVRASHMRPTNRLRTEGTANLLDVARRTGARRFVTQSMVFGYGYRDFGGRVLTEEDPFGPSGESRFGEALAAMRSNEEQVLGAADLEGVALRYGLFYGPGPAGDGVVEGLRRRRVPVFSRSGVLPWVYVDDAAAATVAALDRGVPGSAYNVVDDEPVSFTEIVRAMAAALRTPRPWVLPSWVLAVAPYLKAVVSGGLRVSNEKAKRDLDWSPQRSTYRQGVAEMAEHYGGA